MSEVQKLSFTEKVGYGFGDLASNLFWAAIMSQLLFFYTDIFGLATAAAGAMIAISRGLDAFFDVVIGMAADRTKSRWGKFRPYILWGSMPLSIAAVLAFTTPSFEGTPKLVYAYVTFILFMFMYSTVNIPYTALLGVISGDSVERTSASSFKFIGAYLGGIIVSATLLPLSDHFGKVSIAKGWQATIGIYAAAAFVFLMITFLSTRERIQPIAKEKTDVKSDLRDLSKNLPWIWLFIVTILFILFVCIRMNVTTYYFKYYIGEQASPLLAHTFNFVMQYIVNPVYGIIGKPQLALYDPTFKFGFSILTSAFITTGHALSLVGVILVPWAAKICGRKGAVIVLFIIALITTGSYYFLRPEQLMLIFVFQGIVCVTAGPISALLWVLYADTADHSEWKTGRRATGLVFSASIMSNKLGWAVGSMITAFILAQTGFVANVVQKAEVLVGLKAMMSLVPVAIGAIALIVLIFFYKLDEATMAKVKADLDERRKAGQQASGPFSR